MTQPKTTRMDLNFPVGIDNLSHESTLPAGALRDALNVDIRRDGSLITRPGNVKIKALAAPHSLYSAPPYQIAYYVVADHLYALTAELQQIEIATLTSPSPMSYTVLDGEVYYSNGTDQGIVTGSLPRSWGVESPAKPPVSLADSGFPDGEYQYAVTFVSEWGEESAPSPIGYHLNGFKLTALPQPVSNTVVAIRAYVGRANDNVLLYRCAEVSVGVTETLLGPLTGPVLKRPFVARTPPSTLIRAVKGRIFFLIDPYTMGFTEALEPGLYQPATSFLAFEKPIHLIAPTSGGLFVADNERTFFLAESSEVTFTRTLRAIYGAIKGSHQDIPAEALPPSQVMAETFPVWMDTRGVWCQGLPTGQIVYLTEGRFAATPRTKATTLFRDEQGLKQLLTFLSGEPLPVNPQLPTDFAVTQVNQHGLSPP